MEFYSDGVANINKGLKKALSGDFDALVFDLTTKVKNSDCVEYLKQIAQANTIDFILAVADEKIKEKAIKSIDCNICTYLNSPLDIEEFRLVINNVSEVTNLKKEVVEKLRN